MFKLFKPAKITPRFCNKWIYRPPLPTFKRSILTPQVKSSQKKVWKTTENKMGWNFGLFTPADHRFKEKVINKPNVKALDVGPGHGVALLDIFEDSETPPSICAVDLDIRHLIYIRTEIAKMMPEKLQSLMTKVGNICRMNFSPHSFTYIKATNVCHFFSSSEIRHVVRNFSIWLTPRGEVFISGNSYYTKLNKKTGIFDLIEKNIQEGKPDPTYIENFREIVARFYPGIADKIPSGMYFLSLKYLKAIFKEEGLEFIDGGYIPLPLLDKDAEAVASAIRLDKEDKDHGKEHVWAIGRKPS